VTRSYVSSATTTCRGAERSDHPISPIRCTAARVGGLNGVVAGDGEPDALLLARLAGPFDGTARAALGSLYERHAPALRGFLARFGSADEAQREDWIQETFLIALRHAAAFRAGSARPWLLALAARQVRDSRRSERRRGAREASAVRARAETERNDSARAPEVVDVELERHLAALPERHRVVLELRFVQDLPHHHVAEVLGVSERTAKAWASAALAALRERLGGPRGGPA
jgi:RNA polymerase sigma-70 factor (ECF subfamily)